MWATPQPYLHRTMLEILAQEASDLMLPEIEEAARDDGMLCTKQQLYYGHNSPP